MPCSELWDGALVMIQARWLPRKRETLSAVVHHSFEDPAVAKMPSFGVNLDLITQVLEVSASREGWQLHRLMKQLPGMLWGWGSCTSPPHLKYPALLLPQTMQAPFRSLNTQPFFSGLLHLPSIFSPWSAFPIPSPGSCLLIL